MGVVGCVDEMTLLFNDFDFMQQMRLLFLPFEATLIPQFQFRFQLQLLFVLLAPFYTP